MEARAAPGLDAARPNGAQRSRGVAGHDVSATVPGCVHTDLPATELLVAETDGTRTLWYFARDVQLRHPRPDFAATLARTSSGHVLNLQARAFVRDLCSLVDKLAPDAVTDTQLLTLLPGEKGAFGTRTDQTLTLEGCLKPSIPFSADRFGAVAGREVKQSRF